MEIFQNKLLTIVYANLLLTPLSVGSAGTTEHARPFSLVISYLPRDAEKARVEPLSARSVSRKPVLVPHNRGPGLPATRTTWTRSPPLRSPQSTEGMCIRPSGAKAAVALMISHTGARGFF